MNAEITRRLEQSVSEDEALGGPEVARITREIVAAFAGRGALMARASKRDDWMSGAWVNDPGCFREAMLAAMETILLAHPELRAEEIWRLVESMKSRLLSIVQRLENETREK